MLILFVLLGLVVLSGLVYGGILIFSAMIKPGVGMQNDYLAYSSNQELVKQTEILRRQLELEIINQRKGTGDR